VESVKTPSPKTGPKIEMEGSVKVLFFAIFFHSLELFRSDPKGILFDGPDGPAARLAGGLPGPADCLLQGPLK